MAHDYGNIGGLKPESIERAVARREARMAGGVPADGDRLLTLARALQERESAGEIIPTISEEVLGSVFMNGGSVGVPMLLSALARQRARRGSVGVAAMGAAPTVSRAIAAVTDAGPLSNQLRGLLPRIGTARGIPGRYRP